MPNYVKCLVHVAGEQTRIDKMAEAVISQKGENVYFDLDKIIPMPEALDIPASSDTEDGARYLYLHTLYFSSTQEDKDFLDRFNRFDPERREECIKNGLLALQNVAKYGYSTWYRWRIEKWGTKWNTCENEIDRDNNLFEFQTARNAPLPCIEELSRQYPDLTILIRWADEDTGNNCGEMTYKDGKVLASFEPEDRSREAFELAFGLWPEFRDYYALVDGNYVYSEEDE